MNLEKEILQGMLGGLFLSLAAWQHRKKGYWNRQLTYFLQYFEDTVSQRMVCEQLLVINMSEGCLGNDKEVTCLHSGGKQFNKQNDVKK